MSRDITADEIALAARILKEGGLVAFPTDTVYGLAAHPSRPEAVQRIYEIKGRDAQKAIPLLLASSAELALVCRDMPPAALVLAESFWPGALTLVVRRSGFVGDHLTSGKDTVAVRVPDHPAALALIAAVGVPLATTSANRSGEPSGITADDVRVALGDAVDLILDGGRCPGGRESTLVDVSGPAPTVLRQGALTVEKIAAALGTSPDALVGRP